MEIPTLVRRWFYIESAHCSFRWITMLKVVIFLAVTVTNGCLTSDTGLPPYWDDVPDHLSHFPIVDGTTIIDPWNYLERMAMYKLLLEKTRTAMVPFGPNNTGNVLWGLPMQHGWQLQSGRLGKFGGEPDNCPANQSFCISVSSWWAGMNYYLAVIPFVGAVRAGYYSYWPHPIRLKAPSVTIPSVAPFCKSVQECLATVPASTEAWTHFFLYLKNDTKMDQPSTVESTSSIVSNGSTGKLSPLEDAVLQVMWEAHITSIADGESRVRPLLSRMAQPEQDFGVSWANAVDFLAATHWPTDQPTTHKYQVTFHYWALH